MAAWVFPYAMSNEKLDCRGVGPVARSSARSHGGVCLDNGPKQRVAVLLSCAVDPSSCFGIVSARQVKCRDVPEIDELLGAVGHGAVAQRWVWHESLFEIGVRGLRIARSNRSVRVDQFFQYVGKLRMQRVAIHQFARQIVVERFNAG